MTITYREPGKVIRDILLSEMDLTAGQVMFTNQKFNIPTVGLYLVISYVGPGKFFAPRSQLIDDGEGGTVELQSVSVLHMVQIDIMAYNDPEGGNQARARKEEIAMALASIFSEQQQEKNAMQIARQPGSFLDTSFLEETEMLTRYTMTVTTTSRIQKQKDSADYFTDFTGELNTDPRNPQGAVSIPPVNPLVAA